jgi:hypothetical protein
MKKATFLGGFIAILAILMTPMLSSIVYGGYPGPDEPCVCIHYDEDEYPGPNDIFCATALHAEYWEYPNPYYPNYNYVQWWFRRGTGGNYSYINDMETYYEYHDVDTGWGGGYQSIPYDSHEVYIGDQLYTVQDHILERDGRHSTICGIDVADGYCVSAFNRNGYWCTGTGYAFAFAW